MFTNQDLESIRQHGISQESVNQQLAIVSCDIAKVELTAPAHKGNGIYEADASQLEKMASKYAQKIAGKKIMKFVPASGAATRMFKELLVYVNDGTASKSVEEVKSSLKKFAFFPSLASALAKDGYHIEQLIEQEDYKTIFNYLLKQHGLNFANMPKGLLPFHVYKDAARTAFEEHLVEAALYAKDSKKVARLHFTISAEYEELFKELKDKIVQKYEDEYDVKYDISFSFQHASTDTIAFAEDNQPFRDENGCLVFRPGGHGSLIKNLNEIDADVIFIKNIDNVTIDKLKGTTIKYKKLLASLLLDVQQQVFDLLSKMENNQHLSVNLKAAEEMLSTYFFIKMPLDYHQMSDERKKQFIIRLLDRPIRVCGMVKQEGEPGGGPFWVRNHFGTCDLQIVETSEMNLVDEHQKQIVETSDYFNPVDIVCAIKNYQGKIFDLTQFIDYQRFFVSEKSYQGRKLKAIENPGLWNGAMSNWLTMFVAVPLATFSPVKTINDLLRKEHCE